MQRNSANSIGDQHAYAGTAGWQNNYNCSWQRAPSHPISGMPDLSIFTENELRKFILLLHQMQYKPRNPRLYKTALCRYWLVGIPCRFGNACWFAHGPHEVQAPNLVFPRNLVEHLTMFINQQPVVNEIPPINPQNRVAQFNANFNGTHQNNSNSDLNGNFSGSALWNLNNINSNQANSPNVNQYHPFLPQNSQFSCLTGQRIYPHQFT
ncbi:unnamed protein product [Dracunculus medinensis]|uniref:C3H1-type domain-containing protein n=1 Tax=Dracunculus medinensis TaxID=318479 RepID=A0A0N4U653_DRAME|nr:unnamed protein product [Dracunculus medinensis]